MKLLAKNMLDFITEFLPYRQESVVRAIQYQVALASGDIEAVAICYKARAACSPFSHQNNVVPEEIEKRMYLKLNFSTNFGIDGAWSRLSGVMQNVVDKAISYGNVSAIRMKALAYAWDTPLKNHFDASLADNWTTSEKVMVDRFLNFVKKYSAHMTAEMRQVLAGTSSETRKSTSNHAFVKGIRSSNNDMKLYSAHISEYATAEEKKEYAQLCAFRDCQKAMLDTLDSLEKDSIKMHYLACWLQKHAKDQKATDWSLLSEKLNMWAATLGNYAARRVLPKTEFPKNNYINKTIAHMTENQTSETMSVELLSCGGNKVEVIKVVRNLHPDLGLAEAKKLIESVPVQIKQGLSRQAAEQAVELLAACGATARVISNK